MRTALAFALSLFLTSAASAQSYIYQSGNVTPNHAVRWITNGIVGDGGTAANGFLSSIGVLAQGPAICQQSAAPPSPYNQLCLGVNTAGAATISLQNYGGAAAQNLNFVINGVTYPFPQSLNSLVIGGTAIINCSTNGYGLYNNSGILGCEPITASPGGSNTDLQYNSSGSFGGISGATSDGTNVTFGAATLRVLGSSTGYNTLETANAGASNYVTMFPAASDTVVELAQTQTLTNKTIASSTDVLGGVTLTLGSDATGDIYYRNSGGVLTRLGIGSTGNVLTVSGGLPAWESNTGNFVTTFSAGTTGFTPNSATSGAITLAGTLVVANGGTNCSSASITCFNNITGFTAAGTTGTTSTNLVFSTSPTLVTPALGVATGTSLALGGATLGGNALAVTGTSALQATTITSASANALAVGLNGATNPAFNVNASTGSQAAGLNVTGAATGGTVAVATIDSGSNTNLTINAKGSGTIGIGSVSTGAVTVTPPFNASEIAITGCTIGSLSLCVGSSTPLTVTAAGLEAVANATDTTSGSSGSINTAGGVGITKSLFVGTSGTFGTQQTTQGSLVLANTAAGAYATTIESSNSASASATYTLPTAPPAGNGYSLTATTAGVMSWVNVGGGAGTPCTTTALSIQYDATGSFGCVAGVTSDGTAMTFANGDLKLSGSSSGTSILEAPATGGGTVAFFAGSDTVAGLATAQTFTAANTFTNLDLKLLGSSTGANTFAAQNSSSSSYTTYIPAVTGTVSLAQSPQGRLTLISGTPVMTATQGSTSVIYYDCYHGGNLVPVYNGTSDITLPIGSCEISDTMPTSSTGVTNTTGVFDEWAVNASGTLTLCHATNGSGGGWASDTGGSNTARGTGYSQLDTTTRPYITNTNAITHCYNGATDEGSVSANRATYLGTFYTTGAGKTQFTYGAIASGGTAGLVGIWNAYNRVQWAMISGDSTSSWVYSTTSWRAADAGSVNVSQVCGINEDTNFAAYTASATNAGTTGPRLGVGYNSSTTLATNAGTTLSNASTIVGYTSIWNGNCGLGYNTWYAIEYGGTSNTYYGQQASGVVQSLFNANGKY